MRFFITDVFAERRYAGNRLGTLLGAASLSSAEMQAIAREFNFPETTFVLSEAEEGGAWAVRIFTPATEVDFAGHPTLGTAYVIREHVARSRGSSVVLRLKIGDVPVSFAGEDGEPGVLWMRQVAPSFGRRLAPERVAGVLGLAGADIDEAWPIEEVSTGLPHVLVPLRSMDALRRVSVDHRRYFELVENASAKVLLAFAPGGHEPGQALGVRVFPIAFGIHEDPATGSGNGCLAAYLVRHRYCGSSAIDIATGQGYEMGRPSTLFLRAAEEARGEIRVEVGGRVVEVAEGSWRTGGWNGSRS